MPNLKSWMAFLIPHDWGCNCKHASHDGKEWEGLHCEYEKGSVIISDDDANKMTSDSNANEDETAGIVIGSILGSLVCVSVIYMGGWKSYRVRTLSVPDLVLDPDGSHITTTSMDRVSSSPHNSPSRRGHGHNNRGGGGVDVSHFPNVHVGDNKNGNGGGGDTHSFAPSLDPMNEAAPEII